MTTDRKLLSSDVGGEMEPWVAELVKSRSDANRHLGRASDMGETWLWGGKRIPKSSNTVLKNLDNGTYIDLKTGDIFMHVP